MIAKDLRLLCVLAHPDDESLGNGGMLARYADEGIATYLLTATRGEHGWYEGDATYPGPTALGTLRAAELRAAAKTLGIREVRLLDYIDGDLDQADPVEAIGQIAAYIREVRPDVVVTFDPTGAYGHPDHIAISQFTSAAIVAAASAGAGGAPPHTVAKLYYMMMKPAEYAIYESVFGEMVMHVDGAERRGTGWPDWAITTLVDTEAYQAKIWEAVLCHHTQLVAYRQLEQLSAERRRALWGTQAYVRAFSLVNSGRAVESDLFAGLR